MSGLDSVISNAFTSKHKIYNNMYNQSIKKIRVMDDHAHSTYSKSADPKNRKSFIETDIYKSAKTHKGWTKTTKRRQN